MANFPPWATSHCTPPLHRELGKTQPSTRRKAGDCPETLHELHNYAQRSKGDLGTHKGVYQPSVGNYEGRPRFAACR